MPRDRIMVSIWVLVIFASVYFAAHILAALLRLKG